MTSCRSEPTPADIKAHIGARIHQARIHKGLSLADLGTALGVTAQQVQKYESGRDRIAADRLLLCAQALGRDVTWFFGGAPAPQAAA